MNDVLVVGGGPSGAVLAYELAQRGLHVLIVEKATLPRYKACGGGLTVKTVQNLPLDVGPVLELQAAGGRVSYGGRPLLQADVPEGIAWLVMRDRFDHWLVQRAIDAGARLIEGRAVTAVEQENGRVVAIVAGERLAARLLAGADGVHSVVARSTGLLPRRRTGMALEAEVDVPPAALAAQGTYATFDFGALPHGYGWIFPKSDHLSVGVFHARPGKVDGLRQHMERWAASQAVLRERRVIRQRGHPIPLGGQGGARHCGRVLLVGDAANLADPWLGEGIYYAVRSARLASDALVQALQDGPAALAGYSAQLDAEINAQLRQAALFAACVYRLSYPGSLLLSRSPAMQKAIFGAMRGDLTFGQLNRALLGQLPGIVAQALLNTEGHR